MVDVTRVGIIGLGRMGARLVEAVRRTDLDLVAAHDLAEKPFALEDDVDLAQVFTLDVDTFWRTPVDVLLIATTGPTHMPLVSRGLAQGIRRFVVEKPACTGIAQGERVLAEANNVGARVVVNHGRRYCPNTALLSHLDGSTDFGSLRGISVTLGAGGLGCVGVHYLDLFIRLFGGLPETVRAIQTGDTPVNPRGADFFDPGATVLMTWPSGQRAFLDMADDTGIPPFIEARYTYGRILIENEGRPWALYRRSDSDRELPLTRYGMPLEAEAFPNFKSFGIIDMAEAAIREATGDEPLLSDLEAGLDAIRLFAAIRSAMESDEIARFPLPQSIVEQEYAVP